MSSSYLALIVWKKMVDEACDVVAVYGNGRLSVPGRGVIECDDPDGAIARTFVDPEKLEKMKMNGYTVYLRCPD